MTVLEADASNNHVPRTFANTKKDTLLERQMERASMSHYSGMWCRQRVMRTSLEVIMDVEAELAMHGYADQSTSLFRGCHICLLHLPKLQSSASDSTQAASSEAAGQRLFQSTQDIAKAAADTQQALLDCQARRLSLQAWLYISCGFEQSMAQASQCPCQSSSILAPCLCGST